MEYDGSSTESEHYDELSDDEAPARMPSAAYVCPLSAHPTATSVGTEKAIESGSNQRVPEDSPPRPEHAPVKAEQSARELPTEMIPLPLQISVTELSQALLASLPSRPPANPHRRCASCDSALDPVAARSTHHPTLFCMCCRRPLAVAIFSDVQRAKDNYRRCPSCLRSARDLYQALVDQLPARLRLVSRVVWCFAQLEQRAGEASVAHRILEDDHVLSEQLTAWATARNDVLSHQRVLAGEGDAASADACAELFDAWITNEAESVALRMRQMVALAGWLAARGVVMPGYLTSSLDRFRDEIGSSATVASPAECAHCAAPLRAIDTGSCKPGYCFCCERLLPSTHFESDGEACHICIGGFIGDVATPTLTRTPEPEWLDKLSHVVSVLKIEFTERRHIHPRTSGETERQRELENLSSDAVTESRETQRRHHKRLLQGALSVAASRKLYKERVAADENVVKRLYLVVAFYIESIGQLSAESHRTITELHDRCPLPENIMSHITPSVAHEPPSQDASIGEIMDLISDDDDAASPPSTTEHPRDRARVAATNGLVIDLQSPFNRRRIGQLFSIVGTLKKCMTEVSPSWTAAPDVQVRMDAVRLWQQARRELSKKQLRGDAVTFDEFLIVENNLGEALVRSVQVLLRNLEEVGAPIPRSVVTTITNFKHLRRTSTHVLPANPSRRAKRARHR